MKLTRLEIIRLPGIQPGFALEDIAPGINVVVGPNASGKSSLLRGLRAVLQSGRQDPAGMHVEARFWSPEDGELAATRLGGQLQWQQQGQPVPAPPLPDSRFLDCYTLTLEDLLQPAGQTDQEIAQRLARELAGGYDLDAVREQPGLQLKTNHGRKEAKELQSAQVALSRVLHEQQELRREEQQLDTLRRDKDAAVRAEQEAAACQRALNLLQARNKRLALEDELAEFPPDMARLKGDEIQRLDQLAGERQNKLRQREQEQDKYAQAQRRLDESGLAEAHLEAATLRDYQQSVKTLRDLEQQQHQSQQDLEAARARLRSAREELGADPDALAPVAPERIQQAEQRLEDLRAAQARWKALETEAHRLGAAEESADEADLQQARGKLQDWLQAPSAPVQRGRPLAALALLALAGAAAVALAMWGVHLGAAALLLPMALGAYGLLVERTGRFQRAQIQQWFATTPGVEPPATWDRQGVLGHLDALGRRLQHVQRQQHDAQRQRQIAAEKEQLSQEMAAQEEALRHQAQEVGFDPGRLDASLPRWLRLVSEYDAARQAQEVFHERVAATEQAMALRRQELTAFLQAYGEAPQTEAPQAETFAERLEALAARRQQRDQALQDMTAAQEASARLDTELDRLKRQYADIFTQAGLEPGDRSDLEQRLRQLETWQKRREAQQEALAVERERDRELGEREDLRELVQRGGGETLERQLAQWQEQAGHKEALQQTITRIETRIAEAGQQRRLAQAQSASQAAQDALHQRYEQALFAEAGRFVLDSVEAEHQQTSQPAALRRAGQWFGCFTQYQYALEAGQGLAEGFRARETATNALRPLDQLSSGTRMQLLLAVRIAFALELERGCRPLPFILDESLSTADPARFKEAAASLALFARENDRQIFYLTAQPDDAAYWTAEHPEVQCIDLGHLRGRQQSVSDARAFALPAAPEVPEPAGMDPADYAVVIGVPPVDPFAPVEQLHLFYLLRDRLEMLARLLRLGPERLGQGEALLQQAVGPQLLGQEATDLLLRRIAAARTWLEHHRIGRGEPVGREALEASGAVSETFMDKVAALAADCGGDGAQLLQGLRDGKVERFRSDKREQLAQWLEENGYLDDRPRLAEEQMQLQLLTVLAPRVQETQTAEAEARLLHSSLQRGAAHS
ncbi:MAG: hypothetical protein ACQESV_06295 [Thermodesulfobacteriota bacterium]